MRMVMGQSLHDLIIRGEVADPPPAFRPILISEDRRRSFWFDLSHDFHSLGGWTPSPRGLTIATGRAATRPGFYGQLQSDGLVLHESWQRIPRDVHISLFTEKGRFFFALMATRVEDNFLPPVALEHGEVWKVFGFVCDPVTTFDLPHKQRCYQHGFVAINRRSKAPFPAFGLYLEGAVHQSQLATVAAFNKLMEEDA